MGNCCERCFGRLDKRKYLRTRYNVERDFSIEFENLMEDEPAPEEISNAAIVTTEERHLLAEGKFAQYVAEQKKIDVEIDEELVRQEEELRMEEEAYYEAKREAARAAKAQRQKELANKASSNALAIKQGGPKAWVGEDESDWEVAGGEDDFEMFLESVKARSLAARTRALPAQVPIDQQSTSSITSKGENSRTEASSIDLEWEHEAGMSPLPRAPNVTNVHKRLLLQQQEELLAEITIKPLLLKEKQDSISNDFEWDNDFAESTETLENQKLLSEEDRENDNTQR